MIQIDNSRARKLGYKRGFSAFIVTFEAWPARGMTSYEEHDSLDTRRVGDAPDLYVSKRQSRLQYEVRGT